MRRSIVIVVGMLVSAAACGGSGAAPSTEAQFDAREYAATAERALVATVFESLGIDGIADLIESVCSGLGGGSVAAVVDSLGVDAPASDREIVVEVIEFGMLEVCPGRVDVTITEVYLDAVRRVVDAGGASSAFEESTAIAAAPRVCERFDSGLSASDVLVALVDDLYDVTVTSTDELAGRIDSDQGFVAGAVMTNAAGILCPEHVDAVRTLVESL